MKKKPQNSSTKKPAKKRINSRRKGVKGELEATKILLPLYPEAKRLGVAQQRKEGSDSDIIGTPYWVEVKYAQNPDVDAAIAQSLKDRALANLGHKQIIVMSRKVKKGLAARPWIISMLAEDWIALVKDRDDLLARARYVPPVMPKDHTSMWELTLKIQDLEERLDRAHKERWEAQMDRARLRKELGRNEEGKDMRIECVGCEKKFVPHNEARPYYCEGCLQDLFG